MLETAYAFEEFWDRHNCRGYGTSFRRGAYVNVCRSPSLLAQISFSRCASFSRVVRSIKDGHSTGEEYADGKNQIIVSDLFIMSSTMLASVLFLVVPVLADVHYLYSGFFAGSTIAGIEFDDAALSLTLVSNFSANEASGSKWITLDVGGGA